MEIKKYKPKKIGLYVKILISDSFKAFNKNRIVETVTVLFEVSGYFLVLKKNHKSLAVSKNQGFIKNDELKIFQVVIKENKNNIIELNNCFDRCYRCKYKIKYYNIINNLNNRLWKSIPKCYDEDNITDKNIKTYLYQLEKGDIFRLGDIKFILREFHTFNNNNNNTNNNHNCEINYDNKKTYRSFTLLLENNEGELCDICKLNYVEEGNPMIKLCLCEKYTHFKCMKEKLKEILYIDNDKNGCVRYCIKTHCFSCKQFIPMSFEIKEKYDKYKLYELIDIPRNKSEEYLLFETFDFPNKHYEYIKYFFYIKLREKKNDKNIDTIMIGGNRKKTGKYLYNKIMQIDHNNAISSQHALIDYDIEEKTLTLKNISDSFNTLVLRSEYILMDDIDDNLITEIGNVQIESSLITSDKFKDVENEMENNTEEIEVRESDDF